MIAVESTKPRFFYGYVIVAAGFVLFMVTFGISQSFGVFFRPLLDEFGWSRAETASAYAIIAVVQAAVSVVMGWLTDRLGPKKVISIFGSCIGIAYLLLSQINELWQFRLLYALVGVGTSTTLIPVMTTVSRWFAKKRGLMTGLVQSGVGIGGLIFAPLTGWLITTYGWRSSYSILGIIGLVITVATGLLIKRDPRNVGQLPDGVTRIETPAEKIPVGKRPAESTQAKGLSGLQALHTSQFWVISAIFFSFGFCRSTFLPHIAAHVQDLGFSLADGANVVAALTVSSIPGRFWVGWLSSKSAFMLAFGITTLALAWGMMTGDLWGLYLFSIAFGLGWGAQAVLRFTTTAETFGLASLGLILGIFGLAEAAASAFGSYIAGYVFDIFGSYQIAFILGIAFSIAGVILAWRLTPLANK